jgi:hypothetical protein
MRSFGRSKTRSGVTLAAGIQVAGEQRLDGKRRKLLASAAREALPAPQAVPDLDRDPAIDDDIIGW